MGPSVNLAARLMGMCEDKGVRILCCDSMYKELHDVQKDRHFMFEPFEPVSVKGYAQPVVIYHPKPDQVSTRGRKLSSSDARIAMPNHGRTMGGTPPMCASLV